MHPTTINDFDYDYDYEQKVLAAMPAKLSTTSKVGCVYLMRKS